MRHSFVNVQQILYDWKVCCPELRLLCDESNCGVEKGGTLCCFIEKTRRYWQALVPGDTISEYFETKLVGKTDVISSKLSGIECFIWGMKEPNHIMKIMGTGSALVLDLGRMQCCLL